MIDFLGALLFAAVFTFVGVALIVLSGELLGGIEHE